MLEYHKDQYSQNKMKDMDDDYDEVGLSFSSYNDLVGDNQNASDDEDSINKIDPVKIMNDEIENYKAIVELLKSSIGPSEADALHSNPLIFWKQCYDLDQLWILTRIAMNKLLIANTNNCSEASFNYLKDIVKTKRSKLAESTLSKFQLYSETLRERARIKKQSGCDRKQDVLIYHIKTVLCEYFSMYLNENNSIFYIKYILHKITVYFALPVIIK